MTNRLPKISLLSSVVAAGLLAACGGGGGGGDGGGTGTLNVSMTDAPACGFEEVNVTVNMVRVHQSGDASEDTSGWIDIPVTPTKINLLDLTNGVMTNLGQATLPVGRYTQLRLVLDRNTGGTLANSVVPTGGSEIALTTPSAATSGIKLNGNIVVTEDNTTDITLDFDACKSIVKRGNGAYNLKPVIRIIPMATAGTISGYIDPAAAAAANNPVVSAQVNGEIIRSTVPNADGSFSLYPISAGNYDVVVTSNAYASDVITTVPVTASTTTALGTLAAPLALMTPSTSGTVSGTVSVNGTVSLADAAPLVTATQTFASGKKVAIRYQNVDVSTGAYSLALPIEAPRIAQFGAGTPVADTSATGIYGMEVTATGYQPQSSSATISAGSPAANTNFTLVP
ncbi:DUF4382 domain-containing protein [Oxalobacteraceae bacterium R-40]|uniref:DUF4382 domain-containing protein n=1 Tax=Keguizhuia sedimenti TaxID=3064264 RepID=A0ABU1BP78_9BURK|nr:DUF4382 domain-containing protein [Oxalobacteraceae bacterium R-40]